MTTSEKLLYAKLNTPLRRKRAVGIKILRLYTDVDGVIINKLSVPSDLQKEFPVYMFGEKDRQGAYRIMRSLMPELTGYYFLCTFVYGLTNPFFFGFSGLSDIQNYLKSGDVVTIYTDNLTAPNYFIWIIQTSDDLAVSSFIKQEHAVKVNSVQYFTDNPLQWYNPFFVYVSDELGNFKQNTFDASVFIWPKQSQTKFIEMKWNFILSGNYGFGFYIKFETNEITLNFKVEI